MGMSRKVRGTRVMVSHASLATPRTHLHVAGSCAWTHISALEPLLKVLWPWRREEQGGARGGAERSQQ